MYKTNSRANSCRKKMDSITTIRSDNKRMVTTKERTKVKVRLQYQFSEVSGKKIMGKYVETDYEDPIFLNMQFCMERNKFNKLMRLCKEYKIGDIHQALSEILDETEPERIIEIATE